MDKEPAMRASRNPAADRILDEIGVTHDMIQDLMVMTERLRSRQANLRALAEITRAPTKRTQNSLPADNEKAA